MLIPSLSESVSINILKAAEDSDELANGASPPELSTVVDGGLDAVPTVWSQTRNVNIASPGNAAFGMKRKIASGSINNASPLGTGVASLLSGSKS